MKDVAVVGGGPVGLAAALYCARAGLSVVVHEPRVGPIDKACGEGLMPAAVSALCDLGVDPIGHELAGIRYLAGERSATASFRAGPGRGVRRTVLHNALREAVSAAGIDVLGEAVTSVDQDDAGVLVRGSKTSRSSGAGTRVRYLLAADGLHSPIRRQLGLDHPYSGQRRYGLRQHFAVVPWTDRVEVYWAADAEAYVTPVGLDCVGVAVLTSTRAPFAEQLKTFPELAARLAPLLRHDGGSNVHWALGAGPLRQRSRHRVAARVMLIGDASGYVDALTGEGIALGLAQARVAVDAISADRPQRYEQSWRRVTWRHWFLTQALLKAARTPRIRARLVPAAAVAPKLFGAIVNELARPS